MQETIYSRFAETAARHGDRPAIISSSHTLTFEQLSELVDRIAGHLPRPVTSVGLVLNHGARSIAAILAVLKCGGRYVPAEPSFPPRRIRLMMREAQVDFVLTERDYRERFSEFPTVIIDDLLRENPRAELTGDMSRASSPAYVLYTSGTTGRPKGVCVSNANVCHYVRAFAREFHPSVGDVMLQYSVCSFDIFVEEVFASLLNGATLAIPDERQRGDMRELMAFVESAHVTVISAFPYLLARLNRLPRIPSCVRLLISGGDVLRGVYVDRLLGQAEVYNTYGPSETTVCATYYRCNGGRLLPDGTYPIGTAIQGVTVRIIGEDGEELPQGETGEIAISGDGISLGYIGDHEEENRAFVRNGEDGTIYRSGDMGYVTESGDLAFLHRKDSQIMIEGKRVEVREVESVLYHCEGIEGAAVRAFQDDNGLAYMVAYIVPSREGIRLSEIRASLAESLPAFMIPEFFVKMPSIPLNDNGKPDMSRFPVVMKEGVSWK